MWVILSQRQVKRIVLDFEDATWRAVRIIFLTVQIKGCAFHVTQSMWRHIQECCLQVAYINDDGTFKVLRKIMPLCKFNLFLIYLFIIFSHSFLVGEL